MKKIPKNFYGKLTSKLQFFQKFYLLQVFWLFLEIFLSKYIYSTYSVIKWRVFLKNNFTLCSYYIVVSKNSDLFTFDEYMMYSNLERPLYQCIAVKCFVFSETSNANKKILDRKFTASFMVSWKRKSSKTIDQRGDTIWKFWLW